MVDDMDEEEFIQLRKQADEYLAGWQRAKADYINYKRESEQRAAETVQFANAAMIINLLPLYANMKRAVTHVPPEQAEVEWVKGFGHILSQFQSFLKSVGIEEVKTAGEQFNPEFHEAVAQEKREGTAAGTIVAEVQPGFMLQGRVLQPAKVTVAE